MYNQEIPFNYFYRMFQEINREKIKQYLIEQNNYDEELYNCFDIYNAPEIGKKKQIEFLEESLFDICATYIPVSKSPLTIYPNNPYEFVSLILDTMEKNPYRKSFLESIQFIYQDLFRTLEKGTLMLFSSREASKPKEFLVTLDKKFQITEFEAINMNLKEQAITMNKLLLQMKKGELGPLPLVRTRYRKDI